jgi:hypothetical protein
MTASTSDNNRRRETYAGKEAILVSTDGGTTWTNISDNLPKPTIPENKSTQDKQLAHNKILRSLTVKDNRFTLDFRYPFTDQRLRVHSTDNGSSWTTDRLVVSPSQELCCRQMPLVVTIPTTPTLYLKPGGDQLVNYSAWSRANPDLEVSRHSHGYSDIHRVKSGETLVAIAGMARRRKLSFGETETVDPKEYLIIKSTDGGGSWRIIKDTPEIIRFHFVDCKKRIYAFPATGERRLLRSSDMGETWEDLGLVPHEKYGSYLNFGSDGYLYTRNTLGTELYRSKEQVCRSGTEELEDPFPQDLSAESIDVVKRILTLLNENPKIQTSVDYKPRGYDVASIDKRNTVISDVFYEAAKKVLKNPGYTAELLTSVKTIYQASLDNPDIFARDDAILISIPDENSIMEADDFEEATIWNDWCFFMKAWHTTILKALTGGSGDNPEKEKFLSDPDYYTSHTESQGYPGGQLLNEESEFRARGIAKNLIFANLGYSMLKHSNTSYGSRNKWNTSDRIQVKVWINEALRLSDIRFFENQAEDKNRFIIVADLKKPIGTKDQTKMRIIVQGKNRLIVNAFPVN